MKKISFLLLFASALIGFYGCSKKDETPEIYTFTVDGTSKDFSKSIIINDYQDSYGVVLKGSATSGVEGITITLPEEGTATYTQIDYNQMGGLVTKPNISYVDKNGNKWQYYGSNYGTTDINFTINITTYGNNIIAGTFSGKLWAASSNGSTAPLSIKIENGSFSHTGITLATY